MEIDFKKNLDRMRENYARRPIGFKLLPKPQWMKRTDELYSVYTDKKTLFRYGQIYYAYIVQANTLLFKKNSRSDCPAEILFSTSPITEESPLSLKALAREIYSCKNKPLDEVPENYREFARIVTDEMDRSCVDFPGTITRYKENDAAGKDGDAALPEDSFTVPMRMTSIMVFRGDLPGGVLQGSLFPILASPDKCRSALILPKEYWSGEFMTWKGIV